MSIILKIPLLFFLALLLSTMSLVIFTHIDAIKTMYRCKTFSIGNACVVKSVEDLIDSKPEKVPAILTQLASLRRLSMLGGDFRIYSGPLHRLGYMFFLNAYSFDEISRVCPPLVKDGCVHGYVMEYVNKKGMQSGIELCDLVSGTRLRVGCIHALGHSYLEFNNQTVQQAIGSFCKNYSGLEYNACVSGLFHEDSKFGEGVGHENYYERSHTYNTIACDSFVGEDYNICYGAQGSFRQYFPESELPSVTYKICNEARTEEAKNVCRYGISERLDIARGYSFVQ